MAGNLKLTPQSDCFLGFCRHHQNTPSGTWYHTGLSKPRCCANTAPCSFRMVYRGDDFTSRDVRKFLCGVTTACKPVGQYGDDTKIWRKKESSRVLVDRTTWFSKMADMHDNLADAYLYCTGESTYDAKMLN